MDFLLPDGIKVGHANNEYTGTTVILAEKGAVCGCDVRGGAPGTRETELLRSEKMMPNINAVTLSGGSAYGLEAASGVMAYLKDHSIGYKSMGKIVPIVPSAVIYDLNQNDYYYPDKQMGYSACQNATSSPIFGSVGAGKGATVGKIRGLAHASKGGVGGTTVHMMGVNISVIVVVNAFGDVVSEKGKILAGARVQNGFLDTNSVILSGEIAKLLFGTNTTIGCIATDAKISKVEANKLASIAHDGLAKSIRPVHTDFDGDTFFCMATGKKKVLNFMMLQVGVVEAVVRAVENAVISAEK
jgi:L-aminopeptidase/D-esterase-like protein